MKLNWMFAIKYALAILLAWYISSYFGFDKPYWSMMTVAIIGYPDPSLSIAKMAARLVGSFIGVIAVNLIANISLNDHWIFTTLIIIWLSICLFMTLVSRYMMPYMFSLSGYTSAIIAFGISVHPFPITIFNLSQERLMEVMIGIIMYTFIDYILPNQKSPPQSQVIEENIHSNRKHILSNLFKKHPEKVLQSLNSVITNSIAYDEMSKYESHFLSFKKTNSKILQLPILIVFSIIGIGRKQFLTYAEYSQFLAIKKSINLPKKVEFYRFFDWQDAFLNTFRLILSLVISVLFWLNTGWEFGYILPVLISISFTFGVTIPKANKLAFIILIVAFLVVILSYILKFYFLIQASSFFQAALIMLPVFILLGILKTVGKLAFLISHVMCISLIFMINFTNPMVFDFTFFSNTSIALIFSIIIVILMLCIIPLSDSKQVEERKIKFILEKFSRKKLDDDFLSKIRNTLLLNIHSLSDNKTANRFYVLIALISLYEITQSEVSKEVMLNAIKSVSMQKDKMETLSLLSKDDALNTDIYIKYANEVIKFLL